VVCAGSSTGCFSALLLPPSQSNCKHGANSLTDGCNEYSDSQVLATKRSQSTQVPPAVSFYLLAVPLQAFPGGFAWECLDVLAGPPKVTFK
jgi:hypothetical protein